MVTKMNVSEVVKNFVVQLLRAVLLEQKLLLKLKVVEEIHLLAEVVVVDLHEHIH